MNKNSFVFFLLGTLGLLAASPAQAQVNVTRISLGASYWQPSLDYWNNRSFLNDYNSGQGAKLKGRVMPTASVEVALVKNLSVGARVGYWKNSASGTVSVGGTTRTEELSLAIVPVALDLKYTLATGDSTKTPFLTPYVGASLARYFVTDKLNRQVSGGTGSVNETQTGNTYGAQVFVGAEKKLVRWLYLALDVRYHLGSYGQIVRTETVTNRESVSLNGVEAGLSLRAKLR